MKIEKPREPSVVSRSPSLVKDKPSGMKAVAAVPTGGTAGPIFGFKMQKTVLSKVSFVIYYLGRGGNAIKVHISGEIGKMYRNCPPPYLK